MRIKLNKCGQSGTRMLVVMAAVLLLTGTMTAVAYASTDPTNITIAGGTLNISSMTVGDFAGVTLSGSATNDTATMTPFTMTDARGLGSGWNVTVQATQFSEYSGGYVPSGRTLAVSSLSMPQPTVAANGTSSGVPTITSGPFIIDSGSAVKIASAATDNGMGAYNFTQGGSLTLSIPANAYAASYRSEVTVSAVSGP